MLAGTTWAGAVFWLLGLVFLFSIGIIVPPYEMDLLENRQKVATLLAIDALLFVFGAFLFSL